MNSMKTKCDGLIMKCVLPNKMYFKLYLFNEVCSDVLLSYFVIICNYFR